MAFRFSFSHNQKTVDSRQAWGKDRHANKLLSAHRPVATSLSAFTGSAVTLPHLLFRQFHGLPAADKLTLADLKDFNDISTDYTCIHLIFFSHTISFWFVLDFPL
jgi:hypothetical protein